VGTNNKELRSWDCIWDSSVDTSDIQKGVTWERASFHFLFFLFSLLLDHFPFLTSFFGDSTWGKQRHMGVFLVFTLFSIWVVQIRAFLCLDLSLIALFLLLYYRCEIPEYAVYGILFFFPSTLVALNLPFPK
jgi:hypothetical protein